MKRIIFSTTFILFLFGVIALIGSSGCANIVPPGGGPKDSLPPNLIASDPKDSSLNFKSNKIVLTFDEYVQLDQNLGENLIVSPVPNTPPLITGRLKNVTVKIKDSLEANTTYSINFGNAIKDVNEGIPYKNFTYVFSTGNTIDENTLNGQVLLAETGKVDSTLIVVLHNNLNDTAIEKLKPRYYAKLDGKGFFAFHFLPKGRFNAFVVPNDYNKRYDDSTKLFAFLNSPVDVNDTTGNIKFYAYQEEKEKPKPPSSSESSGKSKDKDKDKEKEEDKRLKFSTNIEGNEQGLLDTLEITFIRKLKTFDSTGFILTDTNYRPVKNQAAFLDTGRTKVSIRYAWPENTEYRLIIAKTAVADSADIGLKKADTLAFTTKKESDYGSVVLRFTNLDLSKNPVLQIMKGEEISQSVKLTGREWKQRLVEPGEYELSVLFDENKNGKWDPGNYKKRKQPEIVQFLSKKINVRANWDNEEDITIN